MKNRVRLVFLCADTADAGEARAVSAFALELGRRNVETVVSGTESGADGYSFEGIAKERNVHRFNCLTVTSLPGAALRSAASGIRTVAVGTRRMPGTDDHAASFDEIDIDTLLLSGRTRLPEAEEWNITEPAPDPAKAAWWESVFGLSNGHLGIRGCHEEDDDGFRPYSLRGTFVNGLYEYDGTKQIDNVVGEVGCAGIFPVCDWTRIRLSVEGEHFSLFSGRILRFRRSLDMRRGVLTRNVRWESPSGRVVDLESARFVCPVRKHAAVMRYSVEPLNFSGRITLVSEIRMGVDRNSRGEPGPAESRPRMQLVESGGTADFRYRRCRTVHSSLEAAAAFARRVSGGAAVVETESPTGEGTDNIAVGGFVGRHEKLVLDTYLSLHTSIEPGAGDPVERAISEITEIAGAGYEELLSECAGFWSGFWSAADIVIRGNVRDQQAVRFSLFHLRQAHPEDGCRSIPATGITGDNYRGHVFWDTEMFMIPFFLYTEPALVRSLLMYRYRTMDKARELTRRMGNPGVRFAWNTIDGTDNGGILYAALNQYHVNCDIAYAVWRYHSSTRDDEFLFRFGAEMIFEVSRFMFSLGSFSESSDGAFRLCMVCGPDEYHPFVNNNCYTNRMLQFQFEFAFDVFTRMQTERPSELSALCGRTGMREEEPLLWKRAAERMYIPYDRGLGIHAQDDCYLSLIPPDPAKVPLNYDLYADIHWLNLWRTRVSKQADVLLLMFVLGDRFSPEQKRKNFDYYEPKTNHGSSLSPCVHGILSAELGMMEKAEEYLEQTLRLDLYDLKGNSGRGLHFACLGGAWMAVVNGMAGFRDYGNGFSISPRLPASWTGYSFRMNLGGNVVQVECSADGTSVTLLSGDGIRFALSGQEVILTSEHPKIVHETEKSSLQAAVGGR